ncbi:MAG: hypothetical protein Kapaf2KO_11420 [Candidatus Kapaibacteriales bacterium]
MNEIDEKINQNMTNGQMHTSKPTPPQKGKSKWGYGIAAVYTLFALGILSLVFYSRTVNVDLVDENYYEKDLAYQNIIDRTAAAKTLEQDIKVSQTAENIIVSFPELTEVPYSEYSGNFRLLRPSEKDFDIVKDIALQRDGAISIPKERLPKGKWVAQVEWDAGAGKYYFEESFMMH